MSSHTEIRDGVTYWWCGNCAAYLMRWCQQSGAMFCTHCNPEKVKQDG